MKHIISSSVSKIINTLHLPLFLIVIIIVAVSCNNSDNNLAEHAKHDSDSKKPDIRIATGDTTKPRIATINLLDKKTPLRIILDNSISYGLSANYPVSNSFTFAFGDLQKYYANSEFSYFLILFDATKPIQNLSVLALKKCNPTNIDPTYILGVFNLDKDGNSTPVTTSTDYTNPLFLRRDLITSIYGGPVKYDLKLFPSNVNIEGKNYFTYDLYTQGKFKDKLDPTPPRTP